MSAPASALTLLVLLLLAPAPAAAEPRGGAGAPACTAPADPSQATICGIAELRRLDVRLRELERRAASISARQATLAHRARAWQAALEAARQDRAALGEAYAERIAALEEALRQDQSMRRIAQRRGPDGRLSNAAGATLPRPPALERRCLGEALRDCRVTGAGLAVSEDGRSRIQWQAQRGYTEADGVRAGMVLLAEVRGGWRLLGWSFEAQAFDAPRLIAQEGGLLLHVPGVAGGIGRGQADLLYRRDAGAWTEIETESWWDAAPGHLPGGLELRQAVTYDFAEMAAETRLWRAADANCCPGGGGARLEFRIEAQRLVLAGIGLDATARAAQPRAESCPAERATYRLDDPAVWTAELRREGPTASAASDLLLRLQSGASGQVYWFRFAAAQGYGGLSVWPVESPGAETAEDGVRDLETDDGLSIDLYLVNDDLLVLPDAPRSGTAAPRRLFLPELGRALHYGALPQQAGATAAPRETMPPAFWILSACR